MWIIHMWIIDIWLFVPAIATFVCAYGGQSFRVERCRDIVQPICPGVGKDAVEMAAKRAVRPALAVHLQHPVAVYADFLQVGPCGGKGMGCGDPGAGADRAAAGKGPTVFVGVQGYLHKHGKGIAALAGVEVVDLVAQSDGHLGVDDLLGAL